MTVHGDMQCAWQSKVPHLTCVNASTGKGTALRHANDVFYRSCEKHARIYDLQSAHSYSLQMLRPDEELPDVKPCRERELLRGASSSVAPSVARRPIFSSRAFAS